MQRSSVHLLCVSQRHSIKAQDETQMQIVGVLQCLLIQRGRQENGRGQAKRSNQIRVQEVQSGRRACGQGRQNGQAGGYKVQKQARVKTRRTIKRRMQKAGEQENRWLTWKPTRQTGTERQETQG